jgi:uncharacterized membrane protein
VGPLIAGAVLGWGVDAGKVFAIMAATPILGAFLVVLIARSGVVRAAFAPAPRASAG